MNKLSPCIGGWSESASVRSKRLFKSVARTTPACSSAASYTRPEPAIEPVCEAAAAAPCAETPAFSATMGLPTRRATSIKRRPSWNPST